jgi:hypothetical protein
MKYVILTVIAILICVASGWLITQLISSKSKRKIKHKVMMSAAISLGLIIVAGIVYVSIYYHADYSAKDYLQSDGLVEVKQNDDGYWFNGPGTEHAIAFFPGAKVDEKAYAPLMFKLAEEGVDCFLIAPPLNMAIMDVTAPDTLLSAYDYDHWYVMGHSLGGSVAASYCSDNPDNVDGVILLAAYPTEEIPDSERLLSIYGTKDSCLERDVYEESKENWPKDSSEVVIKGANHSGFGNYGAQRGDGVADITADEQQSKTVLEIIRFIGIS